MIIKDTPKELKHVTVYNRLYELIKNGSFPVGYQLPTEPDLAVKMDVSRVTLRRALALLQDDGLISNIRGKGNFVTDPDTLSTVTEYIKKVQHPFPVCCKIKYDNIDLAFRFEPPSEFFIKSLKQETSVVVIADRWYMKSGDTEDTALGYTLSLIPIEIISESRVDLNNYNEFVDFLERDIYQQALRAETQFTFTTTGSFTAGKYNLSETENFVLIVETVFSKDNVVLISNKHFIPVENFKLNINLSDKFEL